MHMTLMDVITMKEKNREKDTYYAIKVRFETYSHGIICLRMKFAYKLFCSTDFLFWPLKKNILRTCTWSLLHN